LALVCALGCGPIIEQATFHARPDTVAPGDLLGPYDGQVKDDTDHAIAQALVVGTWVFQRGVGFVGPSSEVTVTTETGADGSYYIPRLRDLPGGLSTRLASFTLVVYQRGFIAYRSDRYFRDGALRTDFAQRGNHVRLERFGEDQSHARHLAFAGGAPPVRKASAWELELAELELAGVRRPQRQVGGPAVGLVAALLDAWPLLRMEDVRTATAYKGAMSEQRLADLPRTSFYDSHHFKAEGRDEKYDLALRVWRLPKADAEKQYQKLSETLPGVKSADEIATRSLRAGTADILALVWYDEPHGVVAQLTCGSLQCTDHQVLLKMATLVQQRLAGWEPAPTTPPPPSPAPTPPTQPPAAETPTKKSEEDIGKPAEPDESNQPLRLKPPEIKP
jgi:hypothetical protein